MKACASPGLADITSSRSFCRRGPHLAGSRYQGGDAGFTRADQAEPELHTDQEVPIGQVEVHEVDQVGVQRDLQVRLIEGIELLDCDRELCRLSTHV